MFLSVSEDTITEASRLFNRVVSSIEVDGFTDPLLYPPLSAGRRTVAQYFLVMVAMDHRLSRPGRPYEGYVEGKLFHGADLLYRLGAKKLSEDPSFFEAENLARITAGDVVEWLTVRGEREASPPDPELRAELLRDIGLKLLKLYDGDPYLMLLSTRGYLKNRGSGLIETLKIFKAYSDPVEKKAYLLAKFLERRAVFTPLDPHHKEVPVDNHLVRIALRIGLIDVDGNTLERIAARAEFGESEDVMLRMVVRLAYRILSSKAGLDPFILDDFLWWFGRTYCRRENPSCRARGECPLIKVCKAYSNPLYMVPEHSYLNTWWY